VCSQPSFEAAAAPDGYEIVKELVVAKPVGAPAPVTPAKEVCFPLCSTRSTMSLEKLPASFIQGEFLHLRVYTPPATSMGRRRTPPHCTHRLADCQRWQTPCARPSQVESSLPRGAPPQVPVTPEYGATAGQMATPNAPPADPEVETPFGA
jgi:hypothetical protein